MRTSTGATVHALCLSTLVFLLVLGMTTQAAGAGVAVSAPRVMQLLDADRDGELDAGEAAQARTVATVLLSLSWDELDRDGDGAIKTHELASALTEVEVATEAAEEDDADTLDELAEVMSLRVLLDQLAAGDDYADELEALTDAIEDLDDDTEIYSYIVAHPKRYPRLYRSVRTYVRHYPLRSSLKRHNVTHRKLSARVGTRPKTAAPHPANLKSPRGKAPAGHKPAVKKASPKRP